MNGNESKTILIVEDEPLNTKLFRDILEAHGYKTIHTANGLEGLKIVREHRPDLIVMDISLGDPAVTGMDVIKWIKADDDLRAIPIIACTALAMKDQEQQIRQSGCDDYMGERERRGEGGGKKEGGERGKGGGRGGRGEKGREGGGGEERERGREGREEGGGGRGGGGGGGRRERRDLSRSPSPTSSISSAAPIRKRRSRSTSRHQEYRHFERQRAQNHPHRRGQ